VHLLYKYLAPDRVDVVARRLIRYTQSGALNDPFEGRPPITAISDEEVALISFKNLLPEQTKESYNQFNEQQKTFISFELFSALVNARYKALESQLPKLLNMFTPMARKLIYENIDKRFGVLSLSEVSDNILMWSHYAANHTGFVLGFDADHPHFGEKNSEADDLRDLRPVLYTDERPKSPLNELDFVNLFWVKSKRWEYEREWRIVRPLVDATDTLKTTPYAVHLFAYPAECLQELIFGARMLDTTKQALLNAVRADPSMGNIRFKHARIDENDFLIRIEDTVS
jgi:Protein of unknown function (DUF2971)